MAPNTGLTEAQGESALFEWSIHSIGRLLVTNRSVGSPSTINIMLTFPSPSSLDVSRLTKRIDELQQLWPLLCVTIADQRTTNPKFRYRYSSWTADQILSSKTYEANPNNPKAERDSVYEMALRQFQVKISYDSDPLWGITLFRASSNPDSQTLYVALTLDHVIIDGRGAVKLAKALVATDISHLAKEDVELYDKAGIGQGAEELPPYSLIAATIFRMVLVPRLPQVVKRWLGYVPAWPQKISQATIDSPWKSSIVDVPANLTLKLKDVGKKHGVATLNPTFHTAWVLAIWALFIDGKSDEAIWDCSVKDLRDVDKGDPYCMAGHPTIYMWSTGRVKDQSRFWDLAQAYSNVSTDPQAALDGWNMMKMVNMMKNGPTNPEECKYRAPDFDSLPAGDKRACTLAEEEALKKINSMSPFQGMSGTWSNLSYLGLPEGATDMIFGVSGNATGTAFNTCLVGHEGGARIQNAYSDGAAMAEDDVKRAESIFLHILQSIVEEEEKDWTVADLVKKPI
ncbi:unnamed protein product [Clonostachys rosea]|uniref:Condensation domain-containing protein n=1 Tax=Bionectria ochroleuca TaxID=29856 RepID=A0ABY6ULY4_BIOOC|nr:unnamed protein product [Clonostachys rosea]